jgi:alpha-N-arabinofuranosidase
MLEDIDHSIDGGLYADLIQNRAVQDGTLDGWYAAGKSCISVTTANPISDALPHSLKVEFKGKGESFANEGWWGISVRPVTYNLTFWALTKTPTNIRIALVSAANRSKIWASHDFKLLGNSKWTQYTTPLTPQSRAPNTNNLLTITSLSTSPFTLQFTLLSLFPPTHKNRPNGIRPDLMQTLLSLSPTHCRVPGGNNIEGQTVSTRWKWNETIGPLTSRRGRPGDWGYHNTDGMGLFEWLTFCEDLVGADGATILGVYAGYSLRGESVPEAELQPYIDEVLAELEYVLGAPDSPYGKVRARDGRRDPFDVRYIEMGNEDWFSDTYAYRWPRFYKQLKDAYPNLTFVATTTKGGVTFPASV